MLPVKYSYKRKTATLQNILDLSIANLMACCLNALKLAKKLAVLGRIYALGLLNEDEYTKVKNRIMREHGIVTFEAV